jgi:hypothetical protein
MEEYRNKNRSPRVVSTDRLDKPAVASATAPPADEGKLAAPAVWAPSVAPTAAPAVAPPIKTVSVPPQAPQPAAGAVASPAPPAVAPPIKTVSVPQQASEPPAAAPAAPAPVAVSAQPTSPAALNNEGQEKRAAKKAKRKPKPEPRGPAKHDMEDGGTTVASGNANDRAPADRAARRPDRSPRIVERWIERDYDVPSARGDGRRRVTVSRRGGGGIFENLFGGGGRDDDD